MRINNGIKKLIVCVFAAMLAFCACGCNGKKKITLYVPDGAPLIAARGFFESQSMGDYVIDAVLTTGAQISPLISARTPDIAIAPITICAQSFELTDKEYVFVGTAVFGLNHIVTNSGSVPQSLEELKGEVIYAFQKQGTPSKTLRALLTMYDMPYKDFTDSDKAIDENKINIEYLPSPADVRNAMTLGLEGKPASFYRYGLLAEPAVTAVVANGSLKRAFDLQTLWADKQGVYYPQAGVIVRKSLIESEPELTEMLVESFESNSQYVLTQANEAAAYFKDDLMSGELPAKEIIAAFLQSEQGQQALNFESGQGKKDEINAYLAQIGQALPDDAFYI